MTVERLNNTEIMNVLSNVGNFLSGIGTFGLLLLAIWQIPIQLKKFRNQKHLDRVTDIAFELSEATVLFTSALKQLIHPVSWSTEVMDEDKDLTTSSRNSEALSIIKTYRYRSSLYEVDLKKLYDSAWKLNFITKSKEVEIKIDELKKIYWDLNCTVGILRSYLSEDYNLSKEYIEKFKNITDEKRLDLIKDEVLKLLAVDFE